MKSLTPRFLLRLDEIEVDRHPHGQVAGTIWVELVATAPGGAFRHELRLELASHWVERHLVEVGNAVEQPGRANEIVERFSLLVLLGKAMRGVGGTKRAGQRGANDADVRPARANMRDDFLHAVAHGFEGCVAVAAEIVDA